MMKLVACLVAALGISVVTLAGCAAPEDTTPASSALETASGVSDETAKDLADPSFEGMALIGSEGEWTFHLDGKSNTIVASNGKSSVVLDPAAMADGETDEEVESSAATKNVEVTDEGTPIGWKRVACQTGCRVVRHAGCTAIRRACPAGRVYRFRGIPIPCNLVRPIACGGATWAADACNSWCVRTFR